jgi:hypothetical protein
LIVRSCAERDSAIAIGVCATIPAGLGRLFLARADAAMAAMARAPDGCRQSHGEFRPILRRGFPFRFFVASTAKRPRSSPC